MALEAIPTVSVIVPNYNHARYLRRRLDSVLAQTYQDFELILLDDGSTDNSREILADYARNSNIQVEFNLENSGGVFKQWNKGVQKARGRYVWIAESDDYADPHFLARLVPILDEHPGVVFAYCRSWSVGEDEELSGFADSYLDRLDANHWKRDFIVDGLEECRRFFALCDPIPNTSSVVFRRNIYERVGRADERLCMCGDYKAWAAMASEGKVAYVADPLNFYRSHRENIRSRTQAGALGVAEYFQVMLHILDCVASRETHPQQGLMDGINNAPPRSLRPPERIEAARESLKRIADWHFRNNSHISRDAMAKYFVDWDFALVGQEFAISPPGRWRFFRHRCRFYRQYFRRMDWKLRILNLLRIFGAPVIGYRHRHLPGGIFSKIVR